MRASLRRPAALAAVVTVVAVLSAPATAWGVSVQRWAGVDRYATAAAIAESVTPGTSSTVFVVNGLGYADALTAAPAAARREAPVLPVMADAVPDPVRYELRRLAPSRIVVIGGSSAVDDAVVDELASYASGGVERWSGASRYDTALTVATEEFAGTSGGVLVASGEGYADALGAGAAGAETSTPLLLTSRDVLPDETRQALDRLAPTRITVVGGAAAVSAAVEADLERYAPGAVSRVAGADRYATAAMIVRDTWGPSSQVLLAGGVNFPDALAGAALGRPLLLSASQCLPPATVVAYAALGVESVIGLGGRAALSDEALGGTACPAAPEPPPALEPAPPAQPGDPGDAVNCSDFKGWREAQDWFETYYPAHGDVARLDQDDDRIACESLPGAPR